MGDAAWTVLRLINWTREFFARADVPDPRLAAEVLLAHSLGCTRVALYTRFDQVPPEPKLKVYRELVARARQREPVAYLVGEKEFYSLRFKVTPDVLIPRPETETLVAEAVAHLKPLGRAGRLWDVCTGSGCVAIAAAAQVKDASVLATDVSPAAVAVAADNAAAHNLTGRVRCRPADLLDLPADCGEFAEVDAITANPPYVAEGDEVAPEVKCEPKLALYAGCDGLDVIRRLVAAAPRRLAEGGILAMEFGMGQADAVRNLIHEGGAFAEPRIIRDRQGIERAAVAKRK
jgi:release factor glutamine methyltransferase